MKRTGSILLLSFILIAALAVVFAAEKAAAPRTDVLYTCACGPECPCASASVKPGQCSCGKPLAWGHVLRIEGSDAYVCTCKEGCTCKIDPKDPMKCGCGEKLKKASLKGSKLYACTCGGTCTCNTISDKPGKCGCGMELTKFD